MDGVNQDLAGCQLGTSKGNIPTTVGCQTTTWPRADTTGGAPAASNACSGPR